MDLQLLEQTLADRGEPPFRARQVWGWAARGASVADAYRRAGPRAVEGFRRVLLGIIAEDHDRHRFERTSPDKR